ncbi:unnamed protein product [Brassica oleracea var. botrytis]|uniref:RRM domain-containing protein n=3 Tax=Brassica TaxID=3705 RepID=A0A0D3C323_BRAOL|nr:unnamed protein product [Brassica napus]CDY54006.1 BnaCnng25890D [Brassica napus]VDD14004.1 unnamed protein product [Brassica oleracea]
MDTYSSCKGSALKEPFNSEAAAKGKKKTSTRITVRISVEGFNPLRPEDEIKSELINHFESCGDIIRVDVPTDPFYDSRAFVILHGNGLKVREKALQLNGSDIGDWNALVKLAPEEEEEEYKAAVAYKKSLCADLANDKRFLFGIAVLGYDTSLPQDEVESILREHFSSCGEITHVYVDTLDKCTNIYFSKEEGEASALDLNGSKVGGFKITTMRVATVRSNRRSGPGTVGSCIPAHFLEFSRENTKKLEDYMTEWRAKARREKDSALRKHNTFKASKRARG